MDFKTYQKKARETAQYPNLGSNNIYPTLGLVGDPCEAQDNTADISEMKALGWEPKVKVDEYLIKNTVAH